MKKIYSLLLTAMSAATFAQQTISFETSEGYQLGTLYEQNGWEVTEANDGFIQNQVITDETASNGTFSFKNAYEPDFNEQWFPIFGANKTFDAPVSYQNFTISYDVKVDQKLGADFEFVLYGVDENEDFVPVAGVGIENRGYIYLIKDIDFGFDYAETEWNVNEWIHVKIEFTAEQIKYYINDELENTIENFTHLDIQGLNMLHNNYGGNGYYDNFVMTTENLNTKPFEKNNVAVYPNPANNSLSLALPAIAELSEAGIYNIAGQKVIEVSHAHNINVSALAAGTYFVKAVSTDGASYTSKFVKN